MPEPLTLPATVTAVGISKSGELDVIERLDVSILPKPNQILIKVEYAGVNFIDTQQRKGAYPLPPLPAALGIEVGGTIVGLPTDQAVLSNEEYKKRGFQVGGKVAALGAGAFAEYLSAGWESVFPLPEKVTTRLGAAAFVQGITALTFVTEAYAVKQGDYILVHTIAGGLGLIFAQLIKARGGIVIGTTSTAEKAALAKAHGADHVILYKDEDVVARVLEITNGEGVHAIFDGVGKDTFEMNFRMIRTKGTIVLMGAASGPVTSFSPRLLADKNVKYVSPSAANYTRDAREGREYTEELFQLVANGTLKIVVHQEYPLTAEGVRQAQKDLTEGRSAGKLLIKVTSD